LYQIGSADPATAGNYAVDFTFTGTQPPAKDVLITRVFVVAGNVLVPEPGSFALIAVPVLGLLARRRVASHA
jgi:hypothetical protein